MTSEIVVFTGQKSHMFFVQVFILDRFEQLHLSESY